jgi:hypothetical protein
VNQSSDVGGRGASDVPFDLQGMDYSDFHGPRTMEEYRREQRMQRRVTWLVMAVVVAAWVLGFAL